MIMLPRCLNAANVNDQNEHDTRKIHLTALWSNNMIYLLSNVPPYILMYIYLDLPVLILFYDFVVIYLLYCFPEKINIHFQTIKRNILNPLTYRITFLFYFNAKPICNLQ